MPAEENDLPLTCPAGRRRLRETYERGLSENTLKFWFPRSIDTEFGGFLHCFDRDGTLYDDDKSVWAQGRMSWLLLRLYARWEPRPEWLAWGRQGLEFLDRHGFDTDGRMYFQTTRDGRPLRKRRYAYSEAFAAIAHGAYFKAAGDERSRRRARELFESFVDWNFTPGRMPPKFTSVRPTIALGPRMIALVTAQELRDDLGDEPLFTEWIDRCLAEIRDLFVKPELQAVLETVAPDGSLVDHADGRLLNPGHAIEAAWFVLREGRRRGDGALLELGCSMLDWMFERGWDARYGGLFCFLDLHGKPPTEITHEMKWWWPHNEAEIAALLAYEITGERKYAVMHRHVHDWSRRFDDPEFGERYGYLYRDGRPASRIKGNLWKSCFHHPRMQMLCRDLLTEA